MNKIVLEAAALALIAIVYSANAHSGAPDAIENLNKNLVSLSDKSHKPHSTSANKKIYQFWASWCHSCGSILWDIDKILENKRNIEYLAISIDKNEQDAYEYIKKHALFEKYKNNFYFDAQLKLKKYFEIDTVPTILIIDSSNKIIFRHRGHLNSAELNQLNFHLSTNTKGIN